MYECYLNQSLPLGLPPHRLLLKVGMPIILLRNLDFKQGLANGTRLIIEQLGRRVIKAKIMTGSHKGSSVIIPRIPMTPSETSVLPIVFTRRQFPIRPAFAMTINKAQVREASTA